MNSSFESWTGGSPDSWTLDTQGTDCSFIQTTGEDGLALIANVTNNGSGNDGEFYQIVEGIISGNKYDFSIRIKGQNPVSKALRFW